jgi:hypothetical protein
MPQMAAHPGVPSSADTRPLFRSEAIAERQKQYGEVLRIRPFSFVALVCLCLAVTASVILLGLLIRTRYVSGKTSPAMHSQRATSSMPFARTSLCVREIANRAATT